MNKLKSFASSPQGRRTIEQVSRKARQYASDPKNRAKIDEVTRRLRGGGEGRGPAAPPRGF